jgi:group I intron endonuclease
MILSPSNHNLKEPVIYKITYENTLYVGSSFKIESRVKSHTNDLNKNKHHNKRLQNIYNKYGDIFKIEILENCTKENISEKEQYYIDHFKNLNFDICNHVLSIEENRGGFCLTKEMIARRTNSTKIINNRRKLLRDKYRNGEISIFEVDEVDRKSVKLRSIHDNLGFYLERTYEGTNKGQKITCTDHLKVPKKNFKNKRDTVKIAKLLSEMMNPPRKIDVYDLNEKYIQSYDSPYVLSKKSECKEFNELPVNGKKKTFKTDRLIHSLDAQKIKKCCDGFIKSYKGLVFKYSDVPTSTAM